MFCGNCGNPINSNESFCSKCGFHINGDDEKTVAMFGKNPGKDISSRPERELKNQYDPISGNTFGPEIKEEAEKTEQINKNNPYAAYIRPEEPVKEINNIKNEVSVKKQSNTGLIVGIIASGIALVAGIVTLVLLLV